MEQKEISATLARRIPAYFRVLLMYYSQDKSRVSSEEIAQKMKITASQVRTDMNALGCQGQRSYGYGIAVLYRRIADILQLSDKFTAVIIGDKPTASALANSQVFNKRGIKLIARFTEPESEKVRKCAKILDYSLFDTFLKESLPNIVIISCKQTNAEPILRQVENVYVEKKKDFMPGDFCEIWNFSDVDLESDILTVKNIHFSDTLLLLCHRAGKDIINN